MRDVQVTTIPLEPRRRFRRFGGVWMVALIAAMLLGTTVPLSSQPKGSSVVLALVAEPVSMDPAQVTDINSLRVLRNIYDSLVQFAPDSFELRPALATSWTVSKDGLVYTFKLRRGVKFHDGTDFDADAVKFNFDRILDPKHPFHKYGPFPLINFFYGAIKQVRVVDKYTVQLILKEPFAPLLNNLTEPLAGMVSPAAVKKWGKDFSRHPVGTGPFRFVRWEPNVRVVLERNPNYWGGAPKVERVVIRPIVEEQTRLTELLTGNVDIIVDVPPDNVPQVKGNPDLQFVEVPGPHIWWVTLNTSKKPFSDVRVRRAVNYAVNKRAIAIDILKGTGQPASGPIPPAVGWVPPAPPAYPFNPELAKKLLTEAGYGSGLSVVFWIAESGSGMQSPKTMAQAIQADLAAVGINASIQTFEWGAYLAKYGKGLGTEADMAAMSWMLGSGDPDPLLFSTLHSKSSAPNGFNAGYYKNSRVDALVERARRIVDVKERGRLYDQVQKIVVEDAPWIFVDHQVQNAALRKRVKGFRLHPSFIWNLQSLSISP